MQPVPFESFTYPFFDFNFYADSSLLVESLISKGENSTFNSMGKKSLYIHIPFCDTICAFCPFVKFVGSQQRISDYVDALIKEIDLLGKQNRFQNWDIDCIYFGGGTPSVLHNFQIERILNKLRQSFTFRNDIEISFEMEAKSVNKDQMKFLQDVGVTRVSFGLQTFDPKIREIVNLTASVEELQKTIELFGLYFPNRNNMDLMVGFPGQTAKEALLDVEKAAKSGIASISVYPVDYVVTLSRLLEKIRSKEIPKPLSPEDRRQLFYDSRQILKKHFEEFNIYSYGLPSVPPSEYMFDILYGGYFNECLGIGCGAYTSLQGLAYQNISTEKEYINSVMEQKLPIRVASPYHAYEKGLVFFPKLLSYDLNELEKLNLMEIYLPIINQLTDKGFVKSSDKKITLTEKGELYYAELMVLFMSTSQKRLYNSVCDRFKKQLGWEGDNSIFDRKIKDRKMGTMRAMSSE